MKTIFFQMTFEVVGNYLGKSNRTSLPKLGEKSIDALREKLKERKLQKEKLKGILKPKGPKGRKGPKGIRPKGSKPDLPPKKSKFLHILDQ